MVRRAVAAQERGRRRAASAAVAAAEEGTAPPLVEEVTLGSGVKLKIKPVPMLLIRRVGMQIPEPKPPVVDGVKGRTEENAADPAYQEAVNQYQQELFDAAMNVWLVYGTELISVPPGVPRPEDDEWVEELRLVKLDADVSSDKARYLSWLTNRALVTEGDLTAVTTAVMQRSGISEEEVQKAAGSFRGGEVRRGDNGVSSEDPG